MSRRIPKPWGHEEIWAEAPAYLGKVLFIREGHRLSLQHHERKDETIRVLRGRMRLELEDEDGRMGAEELAPGDSRRILPGRKHRFGALEDCEVLEVSTPELDDVVRHQDDYGRAGT